MAKLWGGRFKFSLDKLMESFGASHQLDRRLFKQDIALNCAYAKILCQKNIISKQEFALIEKGLAELKLEIENNKLKFSDQYEDIHSHIENWLFLKIGDAAHKIHTGKSRNDQVATDLKMYLKEASLEIIGILKNILKRLNSSKYKNKSFIPGFTHLQIAQPVSLSLHFSAYQAMFKRDIARLNDGFKRLDIMPLGSGALAGNPFLDKKDRLELAKSLGFKKITENSMDAVSDRDFVIEMLNSLSLIMMHLSRFSEEMIIWSSEKFDYLKISDAFTTGSSLMPQKKNPDAFELIRGKAGLVFGNLQAMLTLMKGLPLTYNRDMQEDKTIIFNALDTVFASLNIFYAILDGLVFNLKNMKKDAFGMSLATKLAEYLVKKGVPFRQAHSIVGQVVSYCLANNTKNFIDLELASFKKIDDRFEADLYDFL